MEKQIMNECTLTLFRIFPDLRRIVFESFDKHEKKLTRTQQVILMAMSDGATSSMSKLAKKINTSNEQATRAVNKLTKMGFIDRFQNDNNHRVVNIRLTAEAMSCLDNVYAIAEKNIAEVYTDGDTKRASDLLKGVKLIDSALAG